MENNFVCIATFVAKDGCEDELNSILTALIKPSRGEEGCLSYDLCRSLEKQKTFTVIEKFVDKHAFEIHGQQNYLIEFKNTVGDLVESVSVNTFTISSA